MKLLMQIALKVEQNWAGFQWRASHFPVLELNIKYFINPDGVENRYRGRSSRDLYE